MSDLDDDLVYVAEHLLGWVVTCCPLGWYGTKKRDDPDLPIEYIDLGKRELLFNEESEKLAALRNYLLSWQGAGEVVEAMVQKGYTFKAESRPDSRMNSVGFVTREQWWMTESLARLPEAIIRAAAAALREDREHIAPDR